MVTINEVRRAAGSVPATERLLVGLSESELRRVAGLRCYGAGGVYPVECCARCAAGEMLTYMRERRDEEAAEAAEAAFKAAASAAALRAAVERLAKVDRSGTLRERVDAENRVHGLRRALGLAQWAPPGSGCRGQGDVVHHPLDGVV